MKKTYKKLMSQYVEHGYVKYGFVNFYLIYIYIQNIAYGFFSNKTIW